MLGKKPQIYAFIDSQNLNVSVQNFGWKMNWKKFREFLRDKYGVTKAFMFIGYVPENEELYARMNEAGFAVVLKPTFDMTKPREEPNSNGNGQHEERHIKGNVDADMVLWAMKEIRNYSKAVVVSGDGDFFSLVEYLIQQKKLLKLLTPTGHYSGLFHQFQSYIDRIDEHRRELAYYDKKRFFKRNQKVQNT